MQSKNKAKEKVKWNIGKSSESTKVPLTSGEVDCRTPKGHKKILSAQAMNDGCKLLVRTTVRQTAAR
jgi:hypothetical protein